MQKYPLNPLYTTVVDGAPLVSKKIPPHYSQLFQSWLDTEIGHFFTEYKITEEGEFTCHCEKNIARHEGDLWGAYEDFLRNIIVPISSEILECRIDSEFDDITKLYTDAQLRNIQFNLKDCVRSVEHVYEGDIIVESRVVYKRPFKKNLALDVTRMFM